MKVGIVVPVYNRPEWVDRCLLSVVEQTCKHWQCVVVDDGSTDSTRVAVGERCRRENRIRMISLPDRGGPSRARNLGASELLRDPGIRWLAFCDSDDEWHPKKIETQIHRLEASRTRVCHTNELWIRNGRVQKQRKKHQKPEGRIFAKCLPLCCVSPSAVLMTREVWEASSGFDETLEVCEDYDLWLRIFALEPVSLCPEALVIKHGGHADQLSQKYRIMDVWRLRALLKIHRGYRHLLNPDEQMELLHWIRKRALWIVQGAKKHGRPDLVEEIGRLLRGVEDV